MRFAGLFLILISVQILSCNNSRQTGVNQHKPASGDLEKLNTYLVQKDRERIQNFMERKNLQLTETGSGLWFQVKKEGSGKFFENNSSVTFSYRCTLLDGTSCYSSDEKGPKTVILGKSELEPGLFEGLKLLKPGSEAVFVLPPFLAYGIVGDGKAIPPRAIIVYEITILN